MAHHRPYTGQIAWRKENLLIVAAEDLIAHIYQPRCQINPHESEMPLQCSAQPAADGKSLWPVDQVFLRDFGSEAGKSAEDLEAAAYHHKQRHGIHPVANANYQW